MYVAVEIWDANFNNAGHFFVCLAKQALFGILEEVSVDRWLTYTVNHFHCTVHFFA